MARLGLRTLGALSPREVLASYRGRRVLLTGHTGFKGSWLTAWLHALGAEVTGLSLAPPGDETEALFHRAAIAGDCRSCIGDIRDAALVGRVMAETRPDIVLHLAAQPLVRAGYADPLGTLATNVMGTAHVLHAARDCASVRAVVCVTTDKVYRNREWGWPYRETDELGGNDPYSASKAAAELVTRSYRTALAPPGRAFGLATARGGNVVGGGDWSADRLVPDIVRAIRDRTVLRIRYPDAIRPWQHVLDLCYAYLLLGATLWAGGEGREVEAWNIGPDPAAVVPVRRLVDAFLGGWGVRDSTIVLDPGPQKPESMLLALDSSLARARLGWRPMLGFESAMEMTAEWYRDYLGNRDQARALLDGQRAIFEQRLLADADTPLRPKPAAAGY